MLQLEPLEQFTIARGLEDWTDSTQYYVQAVIRNAKTDALISTVNLTDQGDHHRYSKAWQVPQDQTGLGFYVLIETSVYSDSGYTTKADSYADKYETYLIQRRMNPNLGMGGGGSDIDYKKLRKIVQEELAALPETPEPPEPKEPDLSSVIQGIQRIENKVDAIKIPQPKETDLRPVLSGIEAVKTAVQSIEMPETDLTPIEHQLHQANSTLDEHGKTLAATNMQDVQAKVEALFTRIKDFFTSDMDEIKAEVASIQKSLDGIAYVTLQGGKKPNDQPKQEVDYSKVLKQ